MAISQFRHIVLAGREFLGTVHQVAFDHHTEHLTRATADLSGDVFGHVNLALVLFAAVGMAAVHHQGGGQLGGFEFLAGGGHAVGIVVGCFATAQNHVAVLVALGLHDGDLAILVHRQEVMATGCGLDGIGRDLDVAIRPVLETDGRRQARSQLAVHLAFGGAGTDGAPADQVADVLG